MQLHKHRIT